MTQVLRGKAIVNTRASHQASDFDLLIRERGAVPIAYPCIAIVPPDDTTELDAALKQLNAGGFDWLVLTSANTVYSLAQRLHKLDLMLTGKFKVAAVGPSTAEAAQAQLGLQVDLVPDDYIAESLGQALIEQGGERVFLPESAIARPNLKDMLMSTGAEVVAVDAYQTVCGSGGVDLPAMLHQGEVDVITFTSSSTVDGFVERLNKTGSGLSALGDARIACIGPKTAQTASEHGLPAAIVPDDYTLVGLLDAIEKEFTKQFGGVS
ncbi:MAG: uroporphyrinogen-III synthase [Anaerolineaceae bacterium]|nr:uroporphyrinogen-III synthase [Anaerolineaceae bacterium]